MSYVLDTNTCIYYLNGRHPSVRTRLLSLRPAEIVVPTIVKAELIYGAHKSNRSSENLRLVRQFLQPFALRDFGDLACERYGELRALLERAGSPIGPNDLVVAATVLADPDSTLVTHNTAEFGRVPGLKIEDWVE